MRRGVRLYAQNGQKSLTCICNFRNISDDYISVYPLKWEEEEGWDIGNGREGESREDFWPSLRFEARSASDDSVSNLLHITFIMLLINIGTNAACFAVRRLGWIVYLWFVSYPKEKNGPFVPVVDKIEIISAFIRQLTNPIYIECCAPATVFSFPMWQSALCWCN